MSTSSPSHERKSSLDSRPDVEAVLSLLEDAIDFMPDDEKDAYLEALRKCPDIVQKESNPLEFLCFEDYDLWKASRRLVKYWQWRKKIYQERAFLPILDLTGFGACHERAVRLIRTWVAVNIPDDSHGDSVIVVDRSNLVEALKSDPSLVSDHGLDFCFWHLEFLRSEMRRQKKDMSKSGLGVMDFMHGLPLAMKRKQSWETLLQEAIPIKLKWMRILCLQKERDQKTWFKAILPSFQMATIKRFFFTSVEVYSYNATDTLKRKLVSLGLSEDGLPPILGGTWSYDNFVELLRERGLLFPDTEANPDGSQEGASPIVETSNFKFSKSLEDDSSELSNSSTSTPAPTVQIQYLQEELDQMPFAKKVSMIKVMNGTPDVFQTESCQTQFYRFHNFDSKCAAEHIAHYWSIRDSLFSDRFILKMNQLGAGALIKDGIRSLHSRFLMLLPKDKEGNFVLSYDPSRAASFNVPSQRRCLFYILHTLTEQSVTECVNVRVLVRINLANESEHNSSNRKFLDVTEAFPINFVAYHVILESEKDFSTEECSKYYQKQLQTNLLVIPNDKIILHTMKSGRYNLSPELSEFGLSKENVPDFWGGNWQEENFLRWQDGVIRREVAKITNMKNEGKLSLYSGITPSKKRRFDSDELHQSEESAHAKPRKPTENFRALDGTNGQAFSFGSPHTASLAIHNAQNMHHFHPFQSYNALSSLETPPISTASAHETEYYGSMPSSLSSTLQDIQKFN